MIDVAVSVPGLRKRYGDHAAVAGISFVVRRGEEFALLGPNADKTTLARDLPFRWDGTMRSSRRQPALVLLGPWSREDTPHDVPPTRDLRHRASWMLDGPLPA